ncbi:MAG TPA: hydroxyacid dehydrogenase [Anaerolineales bacterium]|nr:hydroxyacid dehydrogenase [Anaerolineales bacterium]
MAKWKIIITDGLDADGQEILRAAAEVQDRSGISPDELLEVIGAYDALIVRSRTRVNQDVFAAARRLKVVGRAGVGVDNIDLAAAHLHGVTVINSPLATTQAVAEHTLALMLALSRSIPAADAGLKSGRWLKKELLGVELAGKILGVIGMGNIGSAVARLGAALGMAVLGYDPLISVDELRARGAEPVALADLYARSDFISLHVPLLPETRNLINGQSLGLMKRGVRLICTSRGGLIDETALLGALESGQVAGAGLDVFAKEPPGVSALVTHPAVVATPHIAAQTVEAQARAAADIAREVLAALKGEALRWKVV